MERRSQEFLYLFIGKRRRGVRLLFCPTINFAAPEAMTNIEDQTGPSLGKPQCGPLRGTPKLCGRTCHLLRPKVGSTE